MPRHQAATERAMGDKGATVIHLHRRDAPAPLVVACLTAGDRRWQPVLRRGIAFPLLLLGSLAMHVAAIAAFIGAPRPMPNAGIPAITVDIVIGDNSAAGLAKSRSQEAVVATAPADTPLETVAEEPLQVAAHTVAEEKPLPATDAVKSLKAEIKPPAAIEQAEPPAPERPALAVAEPLRPELTERPLEQTLAQPAPIETPQRLAAVEVPASVAGGIGQGSSAADANYQGQVAAHLARHKRFPPEARRRREVGSTEIKFWIDEGGRVAAVRVVRGSGFARLDQAAEAMVWQASPFPPPPDRAAQSFTVPVSFSIH